MVHIKEFIDRVSLMDSRSKRDLVLSSHDARMLRDEIVKLMFDKFDSQKESQTDVTKVEISGGKW